MRKSFIISAAVALASLISCGKDLEDKVFESFNSIEISEEMRTNPLGIGLNAFVFVSGEEVVIPAKYEIVDKTLNDSQIGFEWYYGAELVSTDETLKLGKIPAGRYNGMLVLTDMRNNAKYSKEFNFQVNASEYEDGWAIITDDGSNSHVNYLTIDLKSGEHVFVEDVYCSATGNTLPSGVSDIQYHMVSCYPQIFAIALAGPTKDCCVDLKFNDMTVLGNYTKEFVDDQNVVFTQIATMDPYTVAVSKEGGLYMRGEGGSSYSRVPHAAFFPSRPAVIDGGLKISHLASFSSAGSDMSSATLNFAYDELNGRTIVIDENSKSGVQADALSADYYRAGAPEAGIPEPFNLKDYKVLFMGGCGADIDFMADSKVYSVVYFLESKTDGKKYIYSFDYDDGGWFGPEGIMVDVFKEFPSDITIDPATMASTCLVGGGNNLILFTANGNKDVYALNALSGKLSKIYTSSTAVSGLAIGMAGDMMASFGGSGCLYENQLVIGMEDGTILVVNFDDSVIAGSKAEVIKSFKSTTGKMTRGKFNPNLSALA